MTDLERLEYNAGALFMRLKNAMIEIERLGKRPIVITHGNGMLDTIRIEPGHATTPQIDRFRRDKEVDRIRRENAHAHDQSAC